jgi:hypothetical protein
MPAVPCCALLQYHIVILPTFRDEHAELVQYLLQLPRLQKQRYFLTQHNPGIIEASNASPESKSAAFDSVVGGQGGGCTGRCVALDGWVDSCRCRQGRTITLVAGTLQSPPLNLPTSSRHPQFLCSSLHAHASWV